MTKRSHIPLFLIIICILLASALSNAIESNNDSTTTPVQLHSENS